MSSSPSRLIVHRAGNTNAKWPAENNRMYSQSTTVSCSPAHSGSCLKAQEKVKKPGSIKARRALKVQLACRKKPSVRISNKGLECVARTPCAINGKRRKSIILTSTPGGTDYLVTPGKHKISLTEFVSDIDQRQAAIGCPALRAAAHYQESMLRMWLDREKTIDPNIYLLSFKEGSALEQFRQMALQSVFQYAINHHLHEKTVHLTCFNISRIIYTRLVSEADSALTHSLFASIVITSLRHAIKNDESFDKSELFRIDPAHVWSSCCYLKDAVRDRSEAHINKLETECLPILESPANPPLSPEYLDRYLGIGEWPEYQEQYRELASYLIGLVLFANTCGSSLRCVPHSRIAAAALVLAIKVINTDNNTIKYEYWPARLEQYTGLYMEELKPIIRGLANLLRHKPRWSQILERYYGKWSEYDWN